MTQTLSLLQILFLALVQGLAEMLPVSSSAHVILAQKLMGLDPSAPELTFLLVMLHTGTMFAALLYFGRRWRTLLSSGPKFHFLKMIVLATFCTGVVGLGLKISIEKILLEHFLHHTKGEVEALFGNLTLMGFALAAAGAVILWSSRSREKPSSSHSSSNSSTHSSSNSSSELTSKQSVVVGLVQGLCLPFRGFSRSGATISVGMHLGVDRSLAEEFSFALAVALTPAAILLELKRLHHASGFDWSASLAPGLIGMVFSFIGGLIALKWLSSWLERGRWHFFGYYCLSFSAIVLYAAHLGI